MRTITPPGVIDIGIACQDYLVRIPGWTETRFLQEAPETVFWEFEDGDIIVHSPVGIRHQQIVGFLTFLMRGFVRDRLPGEVLNGPAVVRLRPNLLYEPDIFFVAADQMDRLRANYLDGAPRLVVEVTSPSTRNYDLTTKAWQYMQHGVDELWVVDLEVQELVRWVRTAKRVRKGRIRRGWAKSRALPGFRCKVAWLWQNPLPNEWDCLQEILASMSP